MLDKDNGVKKTMTDFTVSVFYKLNELPDMVFHEDIPVLMGSQVNAETKENADDNFKRRVENECNFFRRAEGLPEIGVYIVDKRVYQDPETAFRAEEVLTQKAKKDYQKSQIEQEEKNKQKAEEAVRKQAEKEELEEFLKTINNPKLEEYIRHHYSSRKQIKWINLEELYSNGFGYYEIENFKEKLTIAERNYIFTSNKLSNLRKAWIESELDNPSHRPKNDKDIETAQLIENFPKNNTYYRKYKEILHTLPKFVSGFKFYTEDDLRSIPGIGDGSIFILKNALEGKDIKLKNNLENILKIFS